MPTEKNLDSTGTAGRPLRVLISAGEASGDMYGAELMAAVREMWGAESGNAATDAAAGRGQIWGTCGLEFFGLGGERMSEAGCELVVEARDVAVVGLVEVLSHLPGIYREFHRLLAEVDRRRPDVAVLIDFPDWNFRLARQLHRRGIPVVYYVSPQLWAWRKGRLKLVQRYVSAMLVIIPFEREFYARHGVQVEYVGHPLSEIEPPKVSREEFAERWGLDASRAWIALLPGSRRKELRMNLPAMLGAAERLGAEFEFVLPVASTLDWEWVAAEVSRFQGCIVSRFERQGQGQRQEQGQMPHICQKRADMGHLQSPLQSQLPHPSQLQARMGHPGDSSPVEVKLTDDARASLLHARVGVVASGTATVEAAVIGTPFVMVYRVAPLTWTLGRHLVKLPHFGMVNLVAGREVVPELIQGDFTPERVERAVRALLEDGDARRKMTDALAEVRGLLRGLGRGEVAAASADILSGDPGSGEPGAARETTARRAAKAILRVADAAVRKRE